MAPSTGRLYKIRKRVDSIFHDLLWGLRFISRSFQKAEDILRAKLRSMCASLARRHARFALAAERRMSASNWSPNAVPSYSLVAERETPPTARASAKELTVRDSHGCA